VRYLRLLSNSAIAGTLATTHVLVLLLLLNPRVPTDVASLTPIAATIGLFYALHFTALFYVLLVIRQLLASELFSPAWISVSVLSRLAALSTGAGALLMWANLRTFSIVLEPESADAMLKGAGALIAAAGLSMAIAIGHRLTAPRFRAGWAVALFVLLIAAATLPLALRGPARTPPLEARPIDASFDAPAVAPSPRLTVVAMDGGSLELITAAAAEGRLPNFGRILDRGAVMHLATLRPTSAEAVWSAVATGKLPQKNGVRSAGIYRLARGGEALRLLPDYCFANGLVRFGFLSEESYSSSTIRTRPLWSILSLQGMSVGVVNWPLTYPAPSVRGYVVSDRYSQVVTSVGGLVDESMLYPAELRGEVVAATQGSLNDASVVAARVEGVLSDRHQVPGRIDRVSRNVSRTLAQNYPTQVTLSRYRSLDPIGHYFLRYASPLAFGDVTEEERRRLGPVLEGHYNLIDEVIGRAIETIGPSDLLLVVSGYGMAPLGLGKRLLERVIGDPEVNGTHESAPDGFLMAYGAPVAPGRLRRSSVVDVAPSVLYFLGLPIGRDMDGFARTDLFRREFTEERPITFIPTYDR
jgi:hypothetical protein